MQAVGRGLRRAGVLGLHRHLVDERVGRDVRATHGDDALAHCLTPVSTRHLRVATLPRQARLITSCDVDAIDEEDLLLVVARGDDHLSDAARGRRGSSLDGLRPLHSGDCDGNADRRCTEKYPL